MKKSILILILLLLAVPIVFASSRIVVVANSIDYENADPFIDHMDSRGRPVLHITAQDLDAHNQEKFVVILGGPDAPEGIGTQVQELLSEKDMEFIREKRGNKKMFVKTNVWRKGQVVMIIAGNHRTDTKSAMNENKDPVLQESTEAQIEELSKNTLPIELKIEGFNFSQNESGDGNWYFYWVEFSMEHSGTESIQPMIDVELTRKKDGKYEQVFLNTNVTHFDEPFDPKDLWLDNYSDAVKLDAGKHKLIVRLRDGASSEVISEDVEDFLR